MAKLNFEGSVLLTLSILSNIVCGSPLATRNVTQYTFPEITPSTNLTWVPCSNIFYCAMLDVPLDYVNPTSAVASLSVLRLPATTTPYKGMVLINPGGPGIPGTFYLSQNYTYIQTIVGSNYDIVTWDPRGVGYSLPYFNCNQTTTEVAAKRKIKKRDVPSKLHGPVDSEADVLAGYEVDKKFGVACQIQSGVVAEHMTTATTARDMISIANAFARTPEAQSCPDVNTELVNYWGTSYGTALGQTFASMFPERVGRFVIDGVLDPDDWVSGWGLKEVNDADEAFESFFQYCNAAGPTQCAFYTGSTTQDIYDRFEAIFARLNGTLAEEQGWSNASLIVNSLDTFRATIWETAYIPLQRFPFLGPVLVALETAVQDLTEAALQPVFDLLGFLSVTWPGPNFINSPYDINAAVAFQCADTGGSLINATTESLLENWKVIQAQSYIAGDYQGTTGAFACAAWPVTSDDFFLGPFGGKTKNPILFVSNTLDPITPHMNGEKGARIFQGAELLTIEGVGHMALGSANQCAWKKMNTYFQNGTLPGNDNFCKLEASVWNITLPSGSLMRKSLAEKERAHNFFGSLKKRA